ncbi:hypothetical protein G5E17_003411 [Salmonella enterica]|nr:hypothetical protein [Salmonella enterica]
MSKSIADGAKLTPETFADFVERLKYHHRGEGVNRHATADPIFMVQKQTTIYGLAEEYGESKIVHFEECEWESPQEYWDDLDEQQQEELNAFCIDQCDTAFTDLDEDAQWEVLARNCAARRPGRAPYDMNEYIALLIRQDDARVCGRIKSISANKCGKCGDALPVESCPCDGDSACWVTRGWHETKLPM